MATHRRSFFTRRGIAIRRARGLPGARVVPDHEDHGELDLMAGAMHYWRVDREDWGPCLRAMQQLGLRVIDTCVPWGVHELRAGAYDWRRERDLAAFLDLLAEEGMHAIVRPGPQVNAELTYLGFPRRIIEDPAIQAVSGRDTPVWLPAPPHAFPAPSYASRAFRSEVEGWLAAVAAIVVPRLAPDGPVIAVAVDNGSQMFSRLGAYDHDYHPDALAWWDEASGGLEPPRAWDPAHAGRCARWMQFKEAYAARSLSWVRDALAQSGVKGVALFHDLAGADPTRINLPRVQEAAGGLAGMAFHGRAAEHAADRRRALYLAGSATPLAFAPELGMGAPAWWLPPVSASEQQSAALTVLSCGVRAFSVYMAVERDRWVGAPISELGEPRDAAPWLERLLAALGRVGWTSLRRRVPVALIASRADARFAAASSMADSLAPLLGERLDLGPAGAAELALDEDAVLHRRWMTTIERALELARVSYEIVDEGCPVEQMARYHAVVLPTLRRVDRALWHKLHQLGRRGVVIVMGPERPALDELDEPLGKEAALPPRTGLIRAASMDDVAGLADDLAGLAGDESDAWLASQDQVECAVFEDADGGARVLFVGHGSLDAVDAQVAVPAGTSVVDALTGERLAADGDGLLEVLLAPRAVRMLLVD